jgi:hypothetical protein
MKTYLVSDAVQGNKAVTLLLPLDSVVDSLAAKSEEPDGVPVNTSADSTLDEWAVGSACYMCHTCTNFGVQGSEGRPCAKGLSDLIKRRSRVRMNIQASRREGK